MLEATGVRAHMSPVAVQPGRTCRRHVRAGPLVLVKKAVGNDASDIVGSFSEETMRRGARDRRGLRGEAHRRGQRHRAKRCGYTQILSSGTSIAKEHVGTGVGETEGKRLADAMIKAVF